MDLAALHREAAGLARAHERGDPAARERAAAHRADPRKPLKLAGAQQVVAAEHGFPSWARLRAYADRLTAGGTALEHAFHADADYYEERADGLLASALDGTPAAVAAFAEAQAPLTPEGARAVVARRHGLGSWTALRRHVAALDASGEPFARAARAIDGHDPTTLRGLLERFDELPGARGTNGNSLLNLAAATRDGRTVAVLLEHGADPNQPNAHGWTPLHQAAYGGDAALARTLLAAGAFPELEARGEGGTPLAVALFWGHAEAAAVLAAEGLLPRNLRIAAGTGRLDVLDELLGADGAVAPAAYAGRGFVRPHGGFPAWRPADDPQEVCDEALAWAARNDRVAAIERLVARGARPDADVYRGTPLAWAAFCGRVAAVRALLRLGADPGRRSTFGGPTHGEGVTALHLAAQNGHREVVAVLLEGGADPGARDALHGGDAAGWAAFGGHPALAAELAER